MTVDGAIKTVQLEAEIAEAQELVLKYRAQITASPPPIRPQVSSPSRWHGVVATRNDPMADLVGSLPAQWLAAHRGFFLDLLRLDDPQDVQRLAVNGPRPLLRQGALCGGTSREVQQRGGLELLLSCVLKYHR